MPNPLLPLNHCVPDGEPRVFGDRLYLYGSYDVLGRASYCSREYRVFSSPIDDLVNWTDHGVSFRSEWVPWSDAPLYAPDVVQRNGIY